MEEQHIKQLAQKSSDWRKEFVDLFVVGDGVDEAWIEVDFERILDWISDEFLPREEVKKAVGKEEKLPKPMSELWKSVNKKTLEHECFDEIASVLGSSYYNLMVAGKIEMIVKIRVNQFRSHLLKDLGLEEK